MALAGEVQRGRQFIEATQQINPYYPRWYHFAPYLDYFRQAEYEQALAEAQAYNMPECHGGPLTRAAALGQLGRRDEARRAVAELLRLKPDFVENAGDYMSQFIMCDELLNHFLEGLSKAGLAASR